MGSAMMGTGESSGPSRAIEAAEAAVANPLLDDVSLRGAKGLLVSISGNRSLTLYEVNEAATRVRQEVDPDANIIVGATFDEGIGDRLRVSVVASGLDPLPAAAGQSGRSDQQLAKRLTDALSASAPGTQAPGRPLGRQGEVVIELGAPQMAHAGARRPQDGRSAESEHDFAPRAPQDVRRGPRRMPEVGDFPPLAQRELKARAARESAVDKRRPGLFARLTGRSKDTGDSQFDVSVTKSEGARRDWGGEGGPQASSVAGNDSQGGRVGPLQGGAAEPLLGPRRTGANGPDSKTGTR
jgi:cell division protein FtsZ